jgi:hypothetical protein
MNAMQEEPSCRGDDGDGISTGIHTYFSIYAELLSGTNLQKRHSRDESIWDCAVVRSRAQSPFISLKLVGGNSQWPAFYHNQKMCPSCLMWRAWHRRKWIWKDRALLATLRHVYVMKPRGSMSSLCAIK